jgi:hypothetical protein
VNSVANPSLVIKKLHDAFISATKSCAETELRSRRRTRLVALSGHGRRMTPLRSLFVVPTLTFERLFAFLVLGHAGGNCCGSKGRKFQSGKM